MRSTCSKPSGVDGTHAMHSQLDHEVQIVDCVGNTGPTSAVSLVAWTVPCKRHQNHNEISAHCVLTAGMARVSTAAAERRYLSGHTERAITRGSSSWRSCCLSEAGSSLEENEYYNCTDFCHSRAFGWKMIDAAPEWRWFSECTAVVGSCLLVKPTEAVN